MLVFLVAGLGTLTTLNNEKIEAQTPTVIDPNPNSVEVLPKAKVKFKKPKRVADVLKLKDKHKIKLKQLESELLVGNKPIYGIYNIVSRPDEPSSIPETATEIESYINKERLAFFADMVAGEDNLSAAERIEFKSQLDAMKAALSNKNAGSISVTQATFSGDVLNLKQLSQEADVEKVDIEDKELIKRENQKLKLQSNNSSLKQTKNL